MTTETEWAREETERSMESVQELHKDVVHMGELVRQAVTRSNQALVQGDQSAGDEVLAGDDLVDAMELAIARRSTDLIISGRYLSDEEHRGLVAALRVIADLERIADLAEENALISHEASPPHAAGITRRLGKLTDLALGMVQIGLHAFAHRHLRDLQQLREQEDVAEVAQRLLHAAILCHLKSTPGDLKAGVSLLFASHNLGRIACHAANIGEWAIYSATGNLGRLKSYHPSGFPASLLPLV
ncbi:MAG: phosphate uptake regulator PhoU [Armatimonadota bacterium]